MNKKLTDSIKKLILDKWKETKELNKSNFFENTFSYNEDILLFCAPHLIKENDHVIVSHLLPLMTAINSMLRNTKNKAHILFTEEQNEEFNFFNNLWKVIYKKDDSKRIRLEIVKNENLTKISNFSKTQRAKRWGQPNNFANLTFYILNSNLYKNTIIFHHDIIFHKWSDVHVMKNELSQCDLATYFGPIIIKKDETTTFEKLMNAQISNWVKFNKDLFLNQHVHTGVLATSENFNKLFSEFFKENYEKWKKEEEYYKFIEQEIIAIFTHSQLFSKNNLVKNRINEMEGKYSFDKQNIKNDCKFIHYDFNKKSLEFIKEAESYNSLPYALKILYNETKKINKLLK